MRPINVRGVVKVARVRPYQPERRKLFCSHRRRVPDLSLAVVGDRKVVPVAREGSPTDFGVETARSAQAQDSGGGVAGLDTCDGAAPLGGGLRRAEPFLPRQSKA